MAGWASPQYSCVFVYLHMSSGVPLESTGANLHLRGQFVMSGLGCDGATSLRYLQEKWLRHSPVSRSTRRRVAESLHWTRRIVLVSAGIELIVLPLAAVV